MKGFYAALGVVTGIAGVASVIYGVTEGRHGSSAITSGILLLVVAASTVYARRGARHEMSGTSSTASARQPGGRAQRLAQRELYIVIGLIVLFTIIAFAIADAIGAPTNGPGPPAVIVLIGWIVGCSVYGIATKARAHRGEHRPVR